MSKVVEAVNDPESVFYRDKIANWVEQQFDAKKEQQAALVEVSTNPSATAEDQLFASLVWKYGGFNGSPASLGEPRMTLTGASKSKITYNWDVGLSGWGLAHDDAGAVVAIFFKDSSGNWNGGKFDWVSTSRKLRELNHIFGDVPYSNWGEVNWNDYPKTVEFAYVAIKKDRTKRSNILTGSFAR